MEVLGTALSAVGTLLAALRCPELNEYKPQLEDLQHTVEAIDPLLRDVAQMKGFLSPQYRAQILGIKDAVFEADDRLDEFVTIAHQKQLPGDKAWFNLGSLRLDYRTIRKLKEIKKKLDATGCNKQYSFLYDPQPIRYRREKTCSYVYGSDIIGREDELKEIVGMLLDPSADKCDVSFLSIVGIGGLGKTALAQLVFNDPRIQSAFSWKNWTCVSDQDQVELDVKEVLCKILDQDHEESDMEHVQSTLQKHIVEERWLLVLDDVWTENHNEWHDLAKHLVGGQRGSWVVVTTRSLTTARIVGGQVYELQGLSKINSWLLFERVAFTSHQSSNPSDELIKIGQEIVDGCAQVPLAIRVAGSLLYGQDMSKWKLVQQLGLANISKRDDGILPILKLSFLHLESPLKSCFIYCTLFPKDFEMDKEMLKSLWMAQGYIVPLDEGQSIEDACEEYFSILLRRCFFQDIKKDDFNEIYSCKVHDLMHDMALDVSGNEIFYAIDTIRGNLDKNVRHLLVASMREYGNYSLSDNKTHIRSLLHVDSNIEEDTQSSLDALLANCRSLRALDLHSLGIQSLPGCIGELLHLRYLDLSYNDLHVLPKSFTKLCNLQTLNLRGCVGLRELPKDLSRLVKLRFLNVEGCDSLTNMPKGIGKLTCLHWLSDFIVGGEGSSSSCKQLFDSLEDLKALNKLKGSLNLRIMRPKKDRYIVEEDVMREGLYMRNKEHLNGISFDFIDEEGDDGGKDEELSLMENLQPHSNLKYLTMVNYNGVQLPSWLALLQNIVTLKLCFCEELEYLPCLGNLRHLKSIRLESFAKLEYIGVNDPSLANSSSTMRMSELGSCDKELSFFPSLEEVWLEYMPKLKGWMRGLVCRVEDSNYGNKLQLQQLQPCLSRLKILKINICPELTCLPSCPGLEVLSLQNFNEGLQIINMKKDEVFPASSSGYEIVNPNLQKFTIDNMAWPNSLPLEYFYRVNTLNLRFGKQDVGLPNWLQFLPALQTLCISGCINLESIPNWMPKLSSLTTLSIWNCSESLKKRCLKDPHAEDWAYIKHIPNIAIIAIRAIDHYGLMGEELAAVTFDKLTGLDYARHIVWECKNGDTFEEFPTEQSNSFRMRIIFLLERVKSNEDANSCMQKPELSKPNRWNTLSLTLRAIARMKIMVQERYMILYCLRFGDIYEFEREKLIQLWMAAGFLKREPMEDNGERFFEFLLENKYILPSRIGISRQNNWYKVNSEMIPDVRARANSIKDFNMRIGDDNAMANQFADLWHISVQSSNINQSFESLKKIGMVKTLLLLNGSLLTRVPPDFFSTFKFLTALDLSDSRITELPSSIQDAKELCYVDLSGSPINRLPQTIVHLRRLQTLRLKGCTDLFELPERTKELINLRHLDFDVLSQLTLMPTGIGHLTELRTLHAFIVDGQIVDGEKRCNIKELKLMNNLSGTLCISGLEHASSQDAEEATLIDKKRLKHLELRWSDFSEYFPNKEELVRVIQGLKPHPSLEELKVVCYPGECLPDWIGDPQYEWLVSITLFKCENCSNFPCLGRLPQLNNLEIFEMNGVKIIDHTCYGEDKDRVAYHALEKLSINGMYRVEEWKGLRDGDFPCLVKLIINRCPNIALLSSFPRCQSLKHLEIMDCPQLKCLPEDMLSSPLDSLVIDDCPLLREIYSKGGEDSHKIEHVKNVWIESEETESSDKHSTSTEDDDSIDGTHHEDYRDEDD